MTLVNLLISIDSDARWVDYCNLEGRRLKPDDYFRLVQGKWEAKFNDFPIEADNDLDLLVVVVGNPRATCTMDVTIDGRKAGPFSLSGGTFNNNGYGAFVKEIRVPIPAPIGVAGGQIAGN